MISPVPGLVAAVALTWFMLLVASLARSRGWTPAGLKIAFGNRDDVPEGTPFAGRADRAAKNMLENLLLFVGVLFAASLARVPDSALATPVTLFVGARVVYAPLYWAGVRYLRTAAWSVGVVGLGWIAALAIA